MKPIILWMTPPGPNPWKVVTVLEELQVPYEINSIRFEDIKKQPFINFNPNGRAPAMVDPNTELTLWESGAIIQYLIEQYDSQRKLTLEPMQDRALLNQWLMFQMSGQGPYFGQAGWFNFLHPEKLTSAQERYNNEVRRILGVLEKSLEGKSWLVGNKCTFADLAFLPWNARVDHALGVPGTEPLKEFPNVNDWHQRMLSRDSWKKAMQTRDKLMDDQGLTPLGMPKGINNIAEYESKMRAEGDM
ncbi:MAG: glutathione S- transferase, nitrogen catabolite repression regulator [Bogoriella megaspora]|nr:MAG: glutathione S- transferase, nitrogen catabolite repression regulator [Bogoriella megaspora]